MNEAMTKQYVKFDILIDVKTLCRKAKTTTWAQLVEAGFKIGDCSWGEDPLVIKGSGEGHARMGLLAGYMTDTNHNLEATVAKAILPELDNLANGLGRVVLVGYTEGSQKPEPIITVLFEFSQKPGERIKVSKSAEAWLAREEEINKETSLLLVRDLYAGLDTFEEQYGGVPLIQFPENDPVTPEYLRGRRFSPCLTRVRKEGDLKRAVVVNIREHTTEPDGIAPPYLFSLTAEEGPDGVLWLTYEGDADPTDEQRLLVKEVLFAFRAVIYNEGEAQAAPHSILPY